MTRSISTRVCALALMVLLPSAALAEEGIKVLTNQAKIIKLASPADTVVVGNPKIADAAVQDDHTIVLTGKGFGVTNLVVMAADGTPLLDEQVTVVRQTVSTVRVYRRSQVQTLSCSPVCDSALRSDEEKLSDKEAAEADRTNVWGF